MTFGELIKSNHWLSVQSTLLSLYPNYKDTIDEYENVYEQLKLTIAVPSNITICISREMDPVDRIEFVAVSGHIADSTLKKSSSQYIPLEYMPWNKWLGMAIDPQNLIDFSSLEIVTYCLMEMTLIDFDQNIIQREARDMKGTSEEYLSLSEDEKQRYNELMRSFLLQEEDVSNEKSDGTEIDDDFKTINRDVLILFPKQAFFDWINSVFPDDLVKCPKLLANDAANIYLLDQKVNHGESLDYLKRNFQHFFELELFDWCQDEEYWPKKLNWKMMNEWFHISVQSMVFDAGSGPIERNSY